MNKILKKSVSNIDILLFFIIIIIKLKQYSIQIGEGYFLKSSIFPTASSIAIILAIAILLKNKSRVKFLFLMDLIISIAIICDINYFRYFKDLLSIPVIKNGFLLGDVKSSVNSIFKIQDLLYFSDFLVIIPLMKIRKHFNFENISFVKRLAITFSILIIAVSTNSYYFYELSKEQPRLISTMYNKVYIEKKLGLINTHGIDIFNTLKNDASRKMAISKTKEEEIQNYLQANTTESSTALKGVGKGKNLIMIQVEALQNFVINAKVNGEEITPNLNKLASQSKYFDNYYYQVSSGGTSDAEFLSNNSLYPSPSGAAYYMYYDNDYNSIAKVLKTQGYSTNVFHGYKETFWNRNIMYKAEGFDNYYSEKDFNIDETVGLGLSDKSFLNQTVEKLKTMDKPYFSFIITLSSHFPFDDTEHYGDFNTGKYENTLLGNYIKAIHYTDEQLGMFLQKLDDEGISKDSIIVLYGDHNAIPKENEKDLADFMGIQNMNELEWAKLQKVPMMIHFPSNEYAEVNHITSGQIDLYPTLCNILDIQNQDLLGSDLLNTKNSTVVFRNGSFTDGKVFYLSSNSTYYDYSSGEKLNETEDLKAERTARLKELEYSDEILKHNLLKVYDKQNNN
ncbi:LTA synthase family protein [Clostridium omnivorum]|uniref:Sulfatase n=1 Tax=Clostridium omnivorum TaxID=1604902 RepID=A0ABQ5NAM8_9CLOT|nr:LTA synthase family protein [Clostridium sp. E14]GLC32270.1 sulfatase [Clostridium sp. E14]